MRKLLSTGLVIFAGVASTPVSKTFEAPVSTTSPDYRTDPRFQALRNFFERFDCPALAYSREFLEAADDYNLDWRLLPSISYVESTGGKTAPHNNLFGWDSGRAQFTSPAAGIYVVAYRLAYSGLYRDKGLNEVLATYNPIAEYAPKVKSIMRQIAPSEQ